MRLRRELAVIRDLFVLEDVELRHVDSKHMVADDLTKKSTGQLFPEVAVESKMPGYIEYDLEGNAPGDMTKADVDISTIKGSMVSLYLYDDISPGFVSGLTSDLSRWRVSRIFS